MPGTSVPVISRAELIEWQPDPGLLFVSSLLAEACGRPGIEDAGGRRLSLMLCPVGADYGMS
jgi:hypothetical protein